MARQQGINEHQKIKNRLDNYSRKHQITALKLALGFTITCRGQGFTADAFCYYAGIFELFMQLGAQAGIRLLGDVIMKNGDNYVKRADYIFFYQPDYFIQPTAHAVAL